MKRMTKNAVAAVVLLALSAISEGLADEGNGMVSAVEMTAVESFGSGGVFLVAPRIPDTGRLRYADTVYNGKRVKMGPPVALEGNTVTKPTLEFNYEAKTLIIKVKRAMRVTVSAFILTENKVTKQTVEKFLSPGTHRISFNNKKLTSGVIVFKVEGNGFSESKTINLRP